VAIKSAKELLNMQQQKEQTSTGGSNPTAVAKENTLKLIREKY